MTLRTASVFVPALVLAVALLPLRAEALTHSMWGSVQASASPDDINAPRSMGPSAVTSLSDEMTAVSGSGNEALARYQGDLASGSLVAEVYAENAPDGMGGFDWSGASAGATWSDPLTFTVAPGTYPDGVTVGVIGRLEFELVATGRGQAIGSFIANLGTDTFATGTLEAQGNGGTDTITRNQSFVLSVDLLGPGAVVVTPQIAELIFGFSFGSLTAGTQSTPPLPISATGRIEGRAYATSVVVPDGVSWSPDSGVFLDDPIPLVPIPLFVVPILGALLVAGGWRALRGKRTVGLSWSGRRAAP